MPTDHDGSLREAARGSVGKGTIRHPSQLSGGRCPPMGAVQPGPRAVPFRRVPNPLEGSYDATDEEAEDTADEEPDESAAIHGLTTLVR